MREIKFQAFIKEFNKCLDVEYLHISTKEAEVRLNLQGSTQLFSYENEEAILRQYTGLKDRTGKEIYEGDVVKSVGFLDEEETYIVTYNQGEFLLDEPKEAEYEYYNGDYPHGDRVTNWCESIVIGNIYENPELTKRC